MTASENVVEEQKQKVLENLLAFDGTEFLFEQKFKIRIEISRAKETEAVPHGFRYSFVLFAHTSEGSPTRVLATDNAHAPSNLKFPFDHWHATKWNPAGTWPIGVQDGVAITVEDMHRHLMVKFYGDAEGLLEKIGVPTGSVEVQ